MAEEVEKLEEKFLRTLIQPGDTLLYDTNGFFGKLIKFKRGEKYTHIELFVGGDRDVGSRDGEGVNNYPLRVNDIAAIYRSIEPMNLEAGLAWFETVKGQTYDWFGLLSFAWAKLRGKENGKMFCSEFWVRFMRACGVEPFNAAVDADAVSPEMATYSDKMSPVWLRQDKRKVNG